MTDLIPWSREWKSLDSRLTSLRLLINWDFNPAGRFEQMLKHIRFQTLRKVNEGMLNECTHTKSTDVFVTRRLKGNSNCKCERTIEHLNKLFPHKHQAPCFRGCIRQAVPHICTLCGDSCINQQSCWLPTASRRIRSHLNSTGCIQLCLCWLKLLVYGLFFQKCCLVKNPDSPL